MESVSRPGSLQVAGALVEVGHRLLVRIGIVAVDLDGEALEEE